MEQEQFATLLEFFKVLANENRLKIVGLLAKQEHGVEELATLLGIKAPTVSHHLARLKALGLVEMRTAGNDHLYRLSSETLQTLNEQIFDSLGTTEVATLADDVEYSAWEQKVLNTFITEDSIQAVPAGYKKWLVVLKWLADHFEEDRKYTEKEVNAIIQEYYADYCLGRRELVEHGLMTRQDGVYWRIPWQMPEFDAGGKGS